MTDRRLQSRVWLDLGHGFPPLVAVGSPRWWSGDLPRFVTVLLPGLTRAAVSPDLAGGRVKNSEEIVGILEAYDLTGSFRAAAELVSCDHHTVARYVRLRDAGRVNGD